MVILCSFASWKARKSFSAIAAHQLTFPNFAGLP
jgi:hypothetical protein